MPVLTYIKARIHLPRKWRQLSIRVKKVHCRIAKLKRQPPSSKLLGYMPRNGISEFSVGKALSMGDLRPMQGGTFIRQFCD